MHKTGTLRHRFDLRAETSNLSEFRERLFRICADEDVSAQSARLIVLAVDEAISNIIEHAKLAESERRIGVSVVVEPTKVIVSIRDRGRPFDPRPVRKEPGGRGYPRRGFGLYLIHKIADNVEYERTSDGENVLTLTKALE